MFAIVLGMAQVTPPGPVTLMVNKTTGAITAPIPAATFASANSIQPLNASLSAIAAGTYTGASSITTVGALTSGSIASGFTAIGNSALANSAVTISGHSVSLGGSLSLVVGDVSGAVSTSTTVNGHALSGNVTVTASDVGLGSVTNDAQTQAVNTIADLRARPIIGMASGTQVSVAGYYATADGGGGPVRILSTGHAPGTYTDNGGSIIVPAGGNGSAAWLWQYAGSINVRWFGAYGDNTHDDTTAIQSALNVGKNLIFESGYIFGITRELTSSIANVKLGGGGEIRFLSAYSLSGGTLSAINITGENTVIDDLTFNGTGITHASTNNRFLFVEAPNFRATSKSSFINLPYGGSNFNGAICCASSSPYSRIIGAYFENNPGSVFVQGRNCVITGNTIVNPHDSSIALSGTNCTGCVVANNSITNIALNPCSVHISMEEGASNWIVVGNNLYGLNNCVGIGTFTVMVTTEVPGGIIADNVINGGGGSTTDPCCFILHSQYYKSTIISGNKLLNTPTTNSNSRYITVNANNNTVRNNIIECSIGSLSSLVQIEPGSNGLTFSGNSMTIVGSSGRHVLFDVGNYGGVPVSFEGGKYYGGSEGINAEANVGGITNLVLYFTTIEDRTVTNFVSALTILGDKQTFMNAGGVDRPLYIRERCEMYGNGVPSSGTFYNGDRINYLFPASGSPTGIIKASGTWHDMPNLQ